MTISHAVARQQVQEQAGILLEKVLIKNDLSGLTPIEKVQHIKNMCESLGLNPITTPIKLMNFQGKEIPYCSKDATEQLRKNHRISITSIDKAMLDGGVYVVTAYATTPNNRTDAATGAVTISGLKGDALCNAMMKAETKAKRRVTLSICGLGMLDESELDTMQGHKTIDPYKHINVTTQHISVKEVKPVDEHEVLPDIDDIMNCENLDLLQERFVIAYKRWAQPETKEVLKRIIEAKDKRKSEINVRDFTAEMNNVDGEPGEVVNVEGEIDNGTL